MSIKQSGSRNAAADEEESDKSKSEVHDDEDDEEGSEEVCNDFSSFELSSDHDIKFCRGSFLQEEGDDD